MLKTIFVTIINNVLLLQQLPLTNATYFAFFDKQYIIRMNAISYLYKTSFLVQQIVAVSMKNPLCYSNKSLFMVNYHIC